MAVQLIGRTDSLGALQELLADERIRLVTLTGPGGIGKTRLALAAAQRRPNACLVDLAAVDHPSLVLTAIANALSLSDATDRAIIEALDSQAALLVLDNFEHVQPAAADVARLLRECRGLQVLATSRPAAPDGRARGSRTAACARGVARVVCCLRQRRARGL